MVAGERTDDRPGCAPSTPVPGRRQPAKRCLLDFVLILPGGESVDPPCPLLLSRCMSLYRLTLNAVSPANAFQRGICRGST